MNPFDEKTEVPAEVIDNSQVGIAIKKAGISGDRAKMLRDMFVPFELQANEMAEKAYALVVTDESQTDLMQQGKAGREKMRQIRLDIEKRHKEGKADALREGQLYDLIKRVLLSLVTPLEDHYSKQENFAKIQREKRRMDAYDARLAVLSVYMPVDQSTILPLGDMTDEAFEILLETAKATAERKKQAEEEADRLRKEQAQRDEEEKNRIREENERLKKQRAEEQEKLRQEREERERAQKALREKEEQEEAAKKAEASAKRKAQRAPDRDKLLILCMDIEAFAKEKLPRVKDEDAQKILDGITEMLGKAVKWTRDQVDKKL